MKSNMKHSFSNVPTQRLPRSSFQRNFSHKTVLDPDFLCPVFFDDVIPGDTFNVKANFVCKLTSPTIVPLLDNLSVDTHFFFVPYRLVWDNWEKFCGAQDDPGDSIDFTIPIIDGLGINTVGDTADYLGVPIGFSADDLGISALPFRAVKLIWNEWFRDQNLQNSLTINTDNGPDPTSLDEPGEATRLPPKRGKRHDYFTSALPWPAKGSSVSLPLGDKAQVQVDQGIGTDITVWSTVTNDWQLLDDGDPSINIATDNAANDTFNLYADLTNATASTINDIRLAFATQRLLEKDARSGTRYNEILASRYGVTVPDFRLQRPEFLGGGTSNVKMGAIAQTTYEGTQTVENAKGAQSGVGQASGTHSWNKSFVEHGCIIGFASIKSDITYSQGVDRYWHKSTRYDFYMPELATIGEQSILNQEIYFQGDANDELVFGYQERFAEYRYRNSMLSSLMRVDAAANLSVFHLSEDFSGLPTLGSTFITANSAAPLDRAVSVPTQPAFVCDFFFEMRTARPMPVYGVPGNLDRM